jgi:hypothetical protein
MARFPVTANRQTQPIEVRVTQAFLPVILAEPQPIEVRVTQAFLPVILAESHYDVTCGVVFHQAVVEARSCLFLHLFQLRRFGHKKRAPQIRCPFAGSVGRDCYAASL